MQKSDRVDTVLLACTHYPLLEAKIRQYLPAGVDLLSQGEIVAASLKDYLQRHPGMNESLTKRGTRKFFTTDSVGDFEKQAGIFFGEPLRATRVDL